MTPLDRADAAEQLLASPVFREAMADIRAGLVGRLETCPMGDIDTQHEIALTLQICKRIETQLLQYKSAKTIDNHARQQRSFMDNILRRNVPV